MRIRFMSTNKFKIAEVQAILSPAGVQVVPVSKKIEEIQTSDIEALVRDKVLKAFREIGRPVIVEHTGLFLDDLNGFPGGLTQVFWDTLEADRVSALFGKSGAGSVRAATRIGYCDGYKIHQFEGSITGRIAATPKGSVDFQWDCVFIPVGHTETFAEMGDAKNKISMRKLAFDQLAASLKGVTLA